jgi:Uncharacterized protein conserved in bacteria
MPVYVAFLRAVNVGGKNKIRMADLRDTFEKLGLARVRTYIQSGNVLFESDEDEDALRLRIEEAIERVFGLSIRVVLRTSAELNDMIANLPFSEAQIAAAEASATGECLHVAMLRDEPDAGRIGRLEAVETDDQFRVAGRDIYLLFAQSIRNSKLAAKLDQLNTPATVRNWRTITTLAGMAEDMAEERPE